MKKIWILITLLILILSMVSFAQDVDSVFQPPDHMQWWTKARFGMFIHWGLYALPARHEWVMQKEHMTVEDYRKYFELFDPDLYDPVQWAKEAKRAGMKYVVITTKHHDGFCLFDSKYTDYKATNTPWGKDLIKPFVKAFRDEGIRVGFYYSLLDWHHPHYTRDNNHPQYRDAEFWEKEKDRDWDKYLEYMFAQVEEILTQYGTIDTLFLDFSTAMEKDGRSRKDWKSEELIKLVRKLQPNIIVNDRLDLLDYPGGWDYRTPEQFKPREWVKMDGKRVPWETCQTFSGSWGYYRDEHTWKSARQIITMLIETVSKGGNLLMNVGPTARGTFDNRTLERLHQVGDWMILHSRSIYGCTAAPAELAKVDNCLVTYNPEKKRVYLHILDWPMGKIYLENYAGKFKYAQLLHDGSEVKFIDSMYSSVLSEEVKEGTLIIRLPINKPEVEVPVIELFLK